MKTRKAVGSDEISIEVWKCLGEFGIKWLTKLFTRFGKAIRYLMNGGRVLWYLCIKTKVTYKTAQIIEE